MASPQRGCCQHNPPWIALKTNNLANGLAGSEPLEACIDVSQCQFVSQQLVHWQPPSLMQADVLWNIQPRHMTAQIGAHQSAFLTHQLHRTELQADIRMRQSGSHCLAALGGGGKCKGKRRFGPGKFSRDVSRASG